MNSKKIKCIFVVDNIATRYGGQAYSVPSLFLSLSSYSHLNLCLLSGYQTHSDLFDVMVTIPKGFVIRRFKYHSNYVFSLQMLFFILKSKFDVIYLNGVFSLNNYFLLIISYFLNKKIIWAPRGMVNKRNMDIPLKKLFLKTFTFSAFKLSTAIHCTSFSEKSFLSKNLTSSNVFIIPNGFTRIEPSITSRKTSSFLYVGRICPHKNLLNLIKAFDELGIFSSYILNIVGNFISENYRSDFMNNEFFIKNQSRIMLHGNIPRNNLGPFYSSASFFVNPSFSENFGLSILDAISFKLPTLVPEDSPWITFKNSYPLFPTAPSSFSIAVNLKRMLTCSVPLTEQITSQYSWQKISLSFSKILNKL